MQTRRDRKKLATRADLMQAALALFHDKGIVATRIEDITERADVAKGAFYNYFGSKDELVHYLLLDGIVVLQKILQGLHAPKSDIEKRISIVVRAHETFFTTYPEYAVFFQLTRGLLVTKTYDSEQLHAGIRHYLEIIASVLFPKADRTTEDARLQAASILASTLGAYRSFQTALGQPADYRYLERSLLIGLVQSFRTLDSVAENEA